MNDKTTAAPFFFDSNNADSGHTLVLGSTGAGMTIVETGHPGVCASVAQCGVPEALARLLEGAEPAPKPTT